jgi:hypothetical protein
MGACLVPRLPDRDLDCRQCLEVGIGDVLRGQRLDLGKDELAAGRRSVERVPLAARCVVHCLTRARHQVLEFTAHAGHFRPERLTARRLIDLLRKKCGAHAGA